MVVREEGGWVFSWSVVVEEGWEGWGLGLVVVVVVEKIWTYVRKGGINR